MSTYSRRNLSRRLAVAEQAAAGLDGVELGTTSTPLPSPRLTRVPREFSRYSLRLAATEEEREAACRLRFKVFNIELGEGLDASYHTGLDTDKFDAICDHLIVEEKSSHRIVGTYRMQSGMTALANLGYYSAQEFDFAPYEPLRPELLELGRASIDREHRTSEVLTLLWRAIAQYAQGHGLRYLIGCSSLTSKNPQEGWAMYHQLESCLVPEPYRTQPTSAYACPQIDGTLENPPKVPKLLKTYLGIGARIGGAPAWDREFGTIDFLTLMDLEQMTPAAKNRFLARNSQ